MLAVSILLCPVNPNPPAPISIHHSSNKVPLPSRAPSPITACLPPSLGPHRPAGSHTFLEREERRVALSHLANVSLLRDRFFSVKRPNKGRGGRERGDRANTIERHLGNCNGLDSRVAYTFFSSSSSGGNVNRAEVSIDILHVCLRVVPVPIGGQSGDQGGRCRQMCITLASHQPLCSLT